jgi:hypothetical protein
MIAEVQKAMNLPFGGGFRVQQGDLAGWSVTMDSPNRMMGVHGQQACFSDAKSMLDWLVFNLIGPGVTIEIKEEQDVYGAGDSREMPAAPFEARPMDTENLRPDRRR